MKLLAIVFLILLFSGCATLGLENPYTKFYNTTPINDVIFLKEGEKPRIYLLDYINSLHTPSSFIQGIYRIDDIKATLEANGYVTIGYSLFDSNFNKDLKSLTKRATELGATVAVATSQKAGSNSKYVPVTTTINHSGTVGDSSYSGTSTNQSSKVITTNTYSHYAVFYAKATHPKQNLGIILRSLNDIEKTLHSRNTGAVISGVGEKSPAFYANLVKGKIITKVNDQEAFDVSMARKLIENAINDDTIKITVSIGAGYETNIIVKMKR